MLTVIIHSSESKRSATPSCGTLSSSFSTFLITWWLRSIGFPFIFAALVENSGFRWFSSVSENRCHVSRIRYSVLNRLVGTSINFVPSQKTYLVIKALASFSFPLLNNHLGDSGRRSQTGI